MKHRNTAGMDRIIEFVNDWYREHHESPSGRKISARTGIPQARVEAVLRESAKAGETGCLSTRTSILLHIDALFLYYKLVTSCHLVKV